MTTPGVQSMSESSRGGGHIDARSVTARGRVLSMNDEHPELEVATIAQRLHRADERDRALNARESRITALEALQFERNNAIDKVLARASQRDGVAQARDWAAAKRDMAANMQAWISGDGGRAEAEARQESLDDRLHAKQDRASSATDRSMLSEVQARDSESE